jgi:hypothetical protein
VGRQMATFPAQELQVRAEKAVEVGARLCWAGAWTSGAALMARKSQMGGK